jgi:hypothetical protein
MKFSISSLVVTIGSLGNLPLAIAQGVSATTPVVRYVDPMSDMSLLLPSLSARHGDEPSLNMDFWLPASRALSSSLATDIPDQTYATLPSKASSTAQVAVSTMLQSNVPSDIPSSQPSYIPSSFEDGPPSDSPSLTPSLQLASSFSDVPSNVPSNQPSVTSSLPGASEVSVTQSVTLALGSNTILDDASIDIFERVCAFSFLPMYLSTIYEAEYKSIRCSVLDQNLVDESSKRRLLDEDYTLGEKNSTLSLLLRVSSLVYLRSGVEFGDIVQQTFTTHVDTFLSLLFDTLPFFAPKSSSGSGNSQAITGGQTEVQNEEANPSPIIISVAAVMGGVILAAIAAFFVLNSRRNAILNREMPDGTDVSIPIDYFESSDEDLESAPYNVTDISYSTLGMNMMPPSPLGIDSIPRALNSVSMIHFSEDLSTTSIDPESGITPSSTTLSPGPLIPAYWESYESKMTWKIRNSSSHSLSSQMSTDIQSVNGAFESSPSLLTVSSRQEDVGTTYSDGVKDQSSMTDTYEK